MIRALVTAALLAGAATHFFGTAPDVAIGYGLVLSVTRVVLLAAAASHRPLAPPQHPPHAGPTARRARRPRRRT